uniref:PID domain-containing protein n=1 Tax=Monopterus albus TaxID=43700 RepID=A0A3Q3JSB1_MONAL
MSDASEDDNEISFRVKFLGRVEVVRPDGLQILEEAAQSIKTPEKYSTEKAAKKSKVHLFLSQSGIDILENKTKVCDQSKDAFHILLSLPLNDHFISSYYLLPPQFLLYTCPLSTVSFCAMLPSSPKVFGFVARHPAADMCHCYLFQSKMFVSNPRSYRITDATQSPWEHFGDLLFFY